MIRRLHLVTLALLATVALSFAQVGQIPGWPPLTTTVGCSDTSLHTITATGAGSVTTPAGCGHVKVKGWGGGGSGSDFGTAANQSSGAGGAFAESDNLIVTSGVTLVYYSVGPGSPLSTGLSTGGTQTWANIATNSAPASSSNGIVAAPGSAQVSNGVATIGGLCTSSIYATACYGGGNGFGGGNGWGGGGAGSAGAGTAGTSSGGGTGGTPDGGQGGNATPTAGAQPGGGGGTKQATSGPKGGDGQLIYQFSAFLDLQPANDNCALAALAA